MVCSKSHSRQTGWMSGLVMICLSACAQTGLASSGMQSMMRIALDTPNRVMPLVLAVNNHRHHIKAKSISDTAILSQSDSPKENQATPKTVPDAQVMTTDSSHQSASQFSSQPAVSVGLTQAVFTLSMAAIAPPQSISPTDPQTKVLKADEPAIDHSVSNNRGGSMSRAYSDHLQVGDNHSIDQDSESNASAGLLNVAVLVLFVFLMIWQWRLATTDLT